MKTNTASRLVRGWVSLYTRGLPAEVQLARTEEIESDLWSQHDEAGSTGRSSISLGVELLARLSLGIPADIAWRLEAGRLAKPAVERRPDLVSRIAALLATVGAIGWAIAAVDWATTVSTNPGVKAWEIPLVVVLGGASLVALSMALGALGFILLSRFDATIGLISLLGACCGLMGALGVPAAAFVLPAASALTVLGLARIDAVRWSLASIHAVAGVGICLSIPAYNDDSLIGMATATVLVFSATWIVISLQLFAGLPQPRPVPASTT